MRKLLFCVVLALCWALHFLAYGIYLQTLLPGADIGSFQMGWGIAVFSALVVQVILFGVAALFAQPSTPRWQIKLLYASLGLALAIFFLPV